MLDNIEVTVDDLNERAPGIRDIEFTEQISFNDVVVDVKRQIYGTIKEDYKATNGSLTNAEIDTNLAKIKDYPQEQYLKDKIAKQSISDIYRQNKLYDDMDVWIHQADRVPLIYWLDLNDSDTVDIDEEMKANRFPVFHR